MKPNPQEPVEISLDNSLPEIREAIETARRGETAAAVRIFEEFVADHPTHIGAMGHLAYLHELMEQPDSALPVYRRICELAPDYPVARHRLAECFFALGDKQNARKNYRMLRGTPFYEEPKVLQRLALCEPLPLRLLREFPGALRSLAGKFRRKGFLTGLIGEVASAPLQWGAIREVGLSGYLSYLSRHFLRGDAWADARRPCDLCGGEKFRAVFFYLDQKVVRCLDCGLETVERKPHEGIDVQTGYYDEDSTIESFVNRGWQDERLLEQRMDLLKMLFEEAGVSFPQPGGRAFEIGFGQGHFLAEIAKLGYRVQGMETSPKLVRFAEKELGVPGVVGTVESLGEEADPLDLFLAYHVLEHLDSPGLLFEKAHRLLAEGGMLVIETPVADLSTMPFAKKMDEAIGYANYHHLHFFTPFHVREYFNRHGFETVGEYLLYPDTHPTGGFLGRKRGGT